MIFEMDSWEMRLSKNQYDCHVSLSKYWQSSWQ